MGTSCLNRVETTKKRRTQQNMAVFKYLRQFWQSPEADEELRQRMIGWRREPVTVRVEKPMRLDRARSVGYKAKQGFVVVRQRVLRGGRMREKPAGGRRSKNTRRRLNLRKNYRQVAEERAQAKFPNLTVLNSYELSRDGKHYWFEIIFVDKEQPAIKNDRSLKGMADKKGRAQRGLTAAGRRARGLQNKGKGAEKLRPSLNARKGRGN